jgi:hypothetical protein
MPAPAANSTAATPASSPMLPPVTGSVGVDGLGEVAGVLAEGDALPLGEVLALGDGLPLPLDGEGLGEPYPPGDGGLVVTGVDGLGEPYPPGIDGPVDGLQDDRP